MFSSHDVLPPHAIMLYLATPRVMFYMLMPCSYGVARVAVTVTQASRYAGSRVQHMGCREGPGWVQANLSMCLGAGRDVSATGGRDRRISDDTGRLPHGLVRPHSTPSLRIAAQRLPQRRLPRPLSLAWQHTGVISLLGHLRV